MATDKQWLVSLPVTAKSIVVRFTTDNHDYVNGFFSNKTTGHEKQRHPYLPNASYAFCENTVNTDRVIGNVKHASISLNTRFQWKLVYFSYASKIVFESDRSFCVYTFRLYAEIIVIPPIRIPRVPDTRSLRKSTFEIYSNVVRFPFFQVSRWNVPCVIVFERCQAVMKRTRVGFFY